MSPVRTRSPAPFPSCFRNLNNTFSIFCAIRLTLVYFVVIERHDRANHDQHLCNGDPRSSNYGSSIRSVDAEGKKQFIFSTASLSGQAADSLEFSETGNE